MSYVIKYIDEYGEKNYFADYKESAVTMFDTIEEAQDKVESLIEDEYEIFGCVVTDYYIMSVEETEEDNVEHFYASVDEDSKVITLSTNKSNIDYLNETVKTLTDAGCTYLDSKTYENGSKVVNVRYTDDKVLKLFEDEEDEEKTVEVDTSTNNTVFTYTDEDFISVQSVVMAVVSYYRDKVATCATSFDGKWTTEILFEKEFFEKNREELDNKIDFMLSSKFDLVSEE